MENLNFSQCEINSNNSAISPCEIVLAPCETKKKRKYTKRKRHAREVELEVRAEKQAREIRYLKQKYCHMENDLLASRSAARPYKARREYYYWVSDQDVIDFAAGFWLCHPTNRQFRVYLNFCNVYGRIQEAMRCGEWQAIYTKAQWVREFAGWRHAPVDGVYDEAAFVAGQKKAPIEVVRPARLLEGVNDGRDIRYSAAYG